MLGYVIIGIIFLAGVSLCVRLNRNNLKQVDHVENDLGQVKDMKQINEMREQLWGDVRCDQDEDSVLKENEIDCNKPMRVEQKIAFIREKVIQLNKISKELEQVFPEKSFKLDGIIVGNIVEIMASYVYGMSLYRQSEKTHDGISNGKEVQVKGTQSNGRILIHEMPEHLLVEYLNTEAGEIEEIYNGPGEFIWKYTTPISATQNSITVSKLVELNQQVDESDKLKTILPIKQYQLSMTNKNHSVPKKTESQAGKTTTTGYTNKNNQTNKGCLHKPGTHPNQTAYLLYCNECGHEYEANGCDIAIRRCPNCQC